MAKTPATIFDEEESLELSGFEKRPVRSETTEKVVAAAEAVNFTSREPRSKPPKKADNHYRTGRNIPLATKISTNANDLLYSIRAEHKAKENWTLGQIIEFGLQAFQRELDSKKSGE